MTILLYISVNTISLILKNLYNLLFFVYLKKINTIIF